MLFQLRGFLNVHVWLDWCGSTVNDLRRNIHFPNYPDVRLKTKLFHLSHDAHNFGQRVFGFLHPPRTGTFIFITYLLHYHKDPIKPILESW
jgi:beta-1,4-N-acetylgalactosaminyltransferase 3